MAKIHTFIAMMKNKGGSLFRDGLVVPEDNGEVILGDDDGDLNIIVRFAFVVKISVAMQGGRGMED